LRQRFFVILTALASLLLVSPTSAAQAGSFISESGHFRIAIPEGWTRQDGTNFEDARSDFFISHGTSGSWIAVVHRSWQVGLLPTTAKDVLLAQVAVLQSATNTQIAAPLRELSIDGHSAARVLVWQRPYEGYAFRDLMGVVLGPEWSVYWYFFASISDTDLSVDGPTLNTTQESFQALPGLLPFAALTPWVFLGGLAATIAEGMVFVFLILRPRMRLFRQT
jgi:hypothetical protein